MVGFCFATENYTQTPHFFFRLSGAFRPWEEMHPGRRN